MSRKLQNLAEISVEPEAWEELYKLLMPLIGSVTEWGLKHDMPIAIMRGAVFGAAQVIHAVGAGCDCETCHDAAAQMAAEVEIRIVSGFDVVRH